MCTIIYVFYTLNSQTVSDNEETGSSAILDGKLLLYIIITFINT